MIVVNECPKLGIFTDDLCVSQKGLFLIQQLNILVEKLPNFPICCFRGKVDQLPVMPHFPLYPQKLCWTFDGILIATEAETALKILNCQKVRKKLFYVWNNDWQYFNNVSWQELHHIYDNKNLDLISRSNLYASLLEKVWKKPKYIMDNFNHQILIRIINDVFNTKNT